MLYKQGKTKRFYIHRLVAKAFIKNPNMYPIINHKDENKLNNYVENLEWCTVKYNNNYGSAPEKRKNKIKVGKKIQQFDLNGNLLKTWDTIKQARRELNAYHISEVCKNKRKTCCGFIWKYLE